MLMRLNPEHQLEPTDEIVRETADQFAIEPAHWEEIGEGIGNVVLRLIDVQSGGYYLKFYNSQHPIQKAQAEVDFTRAADNAGIPVPAYQPLRREDAYVGEYRATTGNHPYTLSAAIEGVHPKVYRHSYLESLAHYHGQLHNLALSLATSLRVDKLKIESDYSFYPVDPSDRDLYKTDTMARNIYEERITNIWDDLPTGMVHADISRTNFLIQEDMVTGIIDFEDLMAAPYTFCLAGPLWDVYDASRGDMSQVNTYLMSYQEQRKLTSSETENVRNMVTLRGWIALHGALLTEDQRGKRVEQQSRLLRQWIADNQASYSS